MYIPFPKETLFIRGHDFIYMTEPLLITTK